MLKRVTSILITASLLINTVAVCSVYGETVKADEEGKELFIKKVESTAKGNYAQDYTYTVDKAGNLCCCYEQNGWRAHYYKVTDDGTNLQENTDAGGNSLYNKTFFGEVFIPKSRDNGLVFKHTTSSGKGMIYSYVNDNEHKMETYDYCPSFPHQLANSSQYDDGFDLVNKEISQGDIYTRVFQYTKDDGNRVANFYKEDVVICTDAFKQQYPEAWKLVGKAYYEWDTLTEAEKDLLPDEIYTGEVWVREIIGGYSESHVSTMTYYTKEEFAEIVNDLTYYKAEMSPVSDLSLLNNGYELVPSGESFGGITTSTPAPTPTPEPVKAENIYDSLTEEGLTFDSNLLAEVTDEGSALTLLENTVKGMSSSEKSSVKAKDQLAYLAEEVSARASAVKTDGDIEINDGAINTGAGTAATTKASADGILSSNSLKVKSLKTRARVETTKSDSVTITKEGLTKAVDSVEAVTPFAAVEFAPEAVVDVKLENTGANKVAVSFTKGESTSKVTVKFPGIETDNYQAIVDDKGNTLVTKYNPVTNELTAKIDESGVFTVVENEKDFQDIKTAPVEVQNAIKNLASKGIIKGTSETEFSPDSPITRAEIAALIVRILNVDDPNADGGFTDVTKANWYFGAAGSSKRENIVAGYEDNTFRGTVVIPKVQITSVMARTLKNRLGYTAAGETELSVFSDNGVIPQWAKSDVALATYANMVLRRTDGSFLPEDQMTRGDAALVLEKLYDKVW